MLGEAPIRTEATAQKYREMPMGRTGIVGLRLFLRWLRDVTFTLYSAEARRGGLERDRQYPSSLFAHA
ncbi:hypothetical protein GQA12_01820 [Paenibacillus alvei]|nr:hypothetical protein [Paenibacillus alvei]